MMNKRPFRFGAVAEGAQSRDAWIAKARKAEELGYSTFLMPDHFVTEFSLIAALMSVADATSKLRIGSIVFDNDFRHPAVLAREAATLDLLSGGRFELGLGAGWLPSEYEQTGIPFDPPSVRLSRLEEALSIIKGFFTEELVTFSGKYYTVTDLKGIPKPVQRPHPPIFIGGGGKRLLSIAAREADIIGVHAKVNADGTVDMDERFETTLAQKVEWLRQVAGERFNGLELNLLVSVVMITENQRQAAEQYAHERGWSEVTVEQVLGMPYFLIGSVDQIIEEIQMRRERFSISYIAVFDEYMEMFAPVVADLVGT